MGLRSSLFALAAFLGIAKCVTCPGYIAQNVSQTSTGLTARLKLAGSACNIYGTDLDNLILSVEYQTGRLKAIASEAPCADHYSSQRLVSTFRYTMRRNKYTRCPHSYWIHLKAATSRLGKALIWILFSTSIPSRSPSRESLIKRHSSTPVDRP